MRLKMTKVKNDKVGTWHLIPEAEFTESKATVDNGGKITAKKLGSTVITAVSQDGNKKATCTVVENVGGGSSDSGSSNSGTTNIKKYDATMATGSLPKAGIGIGIIISIAILLATSIFGLFKWKNLKDVK